MYAKWKITTGIGCKSWAPHPEGVVVESKNRITLHTFSGERGVLVEENVIPGLYKEIQPRGTLSWGICSTGIVICTHERTGYRRILRNGTDSICTGWADSITNHPDGVIIHRNGQFLLNDTKLICTVPKEVAVWDYYQDGVLTSFGKALYKNGEELVFDDFRTDEWKSCTNSFITRFGNRFLLNGKTLLYEGPYRSWGIHPEGVVICRRIPFGRKFTLFAEAPRAMRSVFT